jgi:branched-chain amino acid transport system permease protein
MIGLKFTSLGIRIRAVSNDAELALIVGVNVHEIIMVSFLVGSALAGAAGVLWAFNSALTPGGGFSALLMGMTAAVIGGVRSLRGTVLGSVLVGVVRELTGWWFSSEWQDAALFLVLIGFMLLSPRGPAGRHTAEKAR